MSIAEIAEASVMPDDTRPGTSTASTTSSPPGINGIDPTARAAAYATVTPASDGCPPVAKQANSRHATSAIQLNSDQPNATPSSRRDRLTDSSWDSVSRHLLRPVSDGLPRIELNHDSSRTPMPSMSSGRVATACASTIRARNPPSEKISDSGVLLAPSMKAPARPSSARPTTCRAPDITSCHDATTGVAPQIRCWRYMKVADSTGPPGSVVDSALPA